MSDPNDNFEQIVHDMAEHVGDKVHALVRDHGMAMPTAGMAAAMGSAVAANLALEVGIFLMLSAFDESSLTSDEVEESFDAVIDATKEAIDAGASEARDKARAMIAERKAKAA